MSVKHLKQYYVQVEDQYFEMQQALKDLNEEYRKGLVPRQVVDQTAAMLLPLKQNYERLSYVMYLLMKPAKESKKWYERQNASLQKQFERVQATSKDCLQEGSQVLDRFKQYLVELEKEAAHGS